MAGATLGRLKQTKPFAAATISQPSAPASLIHSDTSSGEAVPPTQMCSHRGRVAPGAIFGTVPAVLAPTVRMVQPSASVALAAAPTRMANVIDAVFISCPRQRVVEYVV